MNGPAEVQILCWATDNFQASLVPVTRMACRPCGIHKVLPVMQARAYAIAHNKQVHARVTIPNPDHTPLGKYEVID